MKVVDKELVELAAAIEEAEDLDAIAALAKARELLSSLQRAAHQWDHQAMLAGNATAINVERN